MKKENKKYYYPMRDSNDPTKVDLIEISEEIYREIGPEINTFRKREQRAGRCVCPSRFIWKCDMDCALCEYRAVGNRVYMQSDEDADDLFENIGDERADTERAVTDIMLLEEVLDRFRELDPDADKIIALWAEDPDMTVRDMAARLGRTKSTFFDQMKKYRKEFKNISGQNAL